MADLNLSTKAQIAVGQPRVPSAIHTCFTEVEDHINNALIGDDNLTSPNNSVWRPVFTVGGSPVTGSTTVGTYLLSAGAVLAIGSASSVPNWHTPSADVAVAGKTTQVRISARIMTNATAPAATFTVGLYPVNSTAGGSGALSLAVGTVVCSTTFTTPAANFTVRQEGSSVTYPSAATNYVFAVVVSGGTTAAASVTAITATLEMRHS